MAIFIFFIILSHLILICNPLYSHRIAEAKDVDIDAPTIPDHHKLSNEKLLQQTQDLFDTASSDFRVHMRGLKNSALLLEDARTKSDRFRLPVMPAVTEEKTSSLEHAKSEAEQVKVRLEAYQQQLELIQTEQTLIERHIELIKQAQLAAASFEDTLNTLKVPLHEINLRVQDGTVEVDKVPEPLQDYKLTTLRKEVSSGKETLQTALETANTELKVNATRMDEAKKVAAVVETLHTSTQDRYAQELKRQELLKEYTGQEPEALIAKLTQLHDEMVGLNGSLRISQRRFSRAQAHVEQIQSQLDALEAPAENVPQSEAAIGPEEAKEITQQADAIVAYHTERMKHLRELEQGLEQLIKTGEALHGDAVVFNEHMFNMRLPAEILEGQIADGSLDADRVPEAFRPASLADAQAPEADYAAVSLSAVEQAKESHGQIAIEIEKSQTARTEVNDRLEHLQKLIALAEQARKWEQELKDLTAEQVATRFQEIAQQRQTAEQTLQQAREAFDQAQAKAYEEREKFDSLTDPFLRLARQESEAEKSNIIKKLYGFAELDLPAELKDEAADSASELTEQDGGASTQETEQYQNLLSTHSRILEERDQQRDELKAALSALNQNIEAYMNALHEADQLAQHQYANAVELKKRIGRQQLQGDAIPDGITEALNREPIDRLEADIAAAASQRADVEQQIATLSEPNENFEKLRTLFDETLTAVGTRLDRLKDEEVLQGQYQRSRQDLSEAELASLQQTAKRRAETALSREEAWLSLVPSAAANEITDSLVILYKEMIELETKQANLVEQTQVTERVIELGEAEKASIDTLMPLLHQEVEYLTNLEEAAWVRIQAQLMPQQAAEILSAYEAKTGEHLPPPPPIPEQERVAAITKAAETLVERHTETVAAVKWVDLFEERLSISGLDAEIGKYQDQVGAIEAQSAANQRRIYRLSGFPAEVLADLPEDEQPQSEAARQQLLQGDIGALRKDRSNLRQQAVIDILIKLGIIVVAAFILAWIVGLIFNRLSNRAQASTTSGGAQTLLVLSFLKAIVRSAIWVTALVMVLSALGFNIAAILAGLGIGGLAVAMAARETLADVIGGIMIFLERPFVLGDTIQVGSGPVAKVVDMNWRTTKLLGTSTYYFNVPNSQVANSTIQNFTRDKPICDWVTLYVSAEHDPAEVIAASNRALEACGRIVRDQGMFDTDMGGASELGQQTVMVYYPWWYINDYHSRNGIRGDIWMLLWKEMHDAGIKLEIKPFELQEDVHPAVGLLTQSTSES